MQLFEVLELPFAKILMIEPWKEPPHRYFISYRARGDFRSVLGLPVIDEFATFSSPIFFAAAPILGKIYNSGISLGHLRDREMSIDTGWPPLCIGLRKPAPDLPEQWERKILDRIQSFHSPAGSAGTQMDEYVLQHSMVDETSVYATNAPLLPKQLKRICELGTAPFTIAFSTGNRITRREKAQPLSIISISEQYFQKILSSNWK